MAKDILVLMPDQLRADWVGAFGGEHVRTPALDSLASEGAVFTRCYTPSPLCMPARSSFLTGLYPHAHGQWHNRGRVREVGLSYLHALGKMGYRTCHVGKSHLYPHLEGRHLREDEDYMHALGWDDVLECTGPYATQRTRSMLTDWMEAQGIYEIFLDDYRRRREIGVNKAHWPSPLPDGKHMDDFMTRLAVEYIGASDVSQSLYLFVGLGGPHDPWDPPQRFDTFDSQSMPPPLPADPAPEWLTGVALEQQATTMKRGAGITLEDWARVRALYSGRVEHVDHCLGQVLEAWWEARGKDSWVIFWSDHGEMLGDKGLTGKSVFFEPAVRVPVIVRPPGGTSEGITVEGMISLVDITATLYDVAGCEEAPSHVFGTSLVGVFDGQEFEGRPVVLSEVQDRTMVFDGRWKAAFNSANELLQLFDTAQDRGESVNLAGRSDTNEVEERLRSELLRLLLNTMHRQN
jgi:arylsulfatase